MDNHFSIITPVFNGEKTIGRAIRSVLNQVYPNYEMIVINDGSTDRTQEIVSELMRVDRRIRMFVFPENHGRLMARNLGNLMAKNEWICMLDHDDEFMSNYLEVLNAEINRNPDFKIFNFGSVFKHREMIDEKRFEKGWQILEPLKLKEVGDGMESFEKGKITTGAFVFKKELLGGENFYPEARNAYGPTDDTYPAMLVAKDSRFEEICKKNEEGHWLPLGNPWGDDYSFFWWLTRDNKSKCLDVLLHIHHIRN